MGKATCNVLVYIDMDKQDIMEKCGEPALIGTVCYDHSILCPLCRIEPAEPTAACYACKSKEL